MPWRRCLPSPRFAMVLRPGVSPPALSSCQANWSGSIPSRLIREMRVARLIPMLAAAPSAPPTGLRNRRVRERSRHAASLNSRSQVNWKEFAWKVHTHRELSPKSHSMWHSRCRIGIAMERIDVSWARCMKSACWTLWEPGRVTASSHPVAELESSSLSDQSSPKQANRNASQMSM